MNPLTDEQLRARSSGRVTSPEAYNFRTFRPERRGLYSEEIFGEAKWASGELAAAAADDRSERWGHIELGEPVRHALSSSTAPSLAESLAAPSHGQSVVLVVPPVHRRFLLLTPHEHRERLRARRAELLELDRANQWPYSDSLETVLLEEGLADPDELESTGEGMIEPALSTAYRSIVNHANRLKRLVELDAPAVICESQRTALKEKCERLDVVLAASSLPKDVLMLALGLSE